jgi:hypothetical protein
MNQGYIKGRLRNRLKRLKRNIKEAGAEQRMTFEARISEIEGLLKR